jgi:hypothetical protein
MKTNFTCRLPSSSGVRIGAGVSASGKRKAKLKAIAALATCDRCQQRRIAMQKLPSEITDWPEYFLAALIGKTAMSLGIDKGAFEVWRFDSEGRLWLRNLLRR